MTLLEQRDRSSVPGYAAVRWLSDPLAAERAVSGAKAANLSQARGRRLPTVDGFVVTVDEARRSPSQPSMVVRDAWGRLSDDGRMPVVVRSSSTVEDLDSSSMAGMFTSVIDVQGWDAFVDAYRRVVASASGGDMAVLVQRHVRPTRSGVLFGVDPVSGRRDRLVIAAVEGGPDRLVSGEVEGRRTVVTPSGRVESSDGDDTPVLTRSERRRLVRLAGTAAGVFGGPQDIEWAFEGDQLLLLQARPVTTHAAPGTGPLLGQGPVAETFPDPLSVLEADLWTPPLREAIAETLMLTGSAGRRRIDRSPVLTVVEGYAVVDLELVGAAGRRRRLVAAIDPRPQVRRLAASWRVGRLRGALPRLAADLVERIDQELGSLPAVGDLTDAELVRVLDNSHAHLRALHGHEMLTGSLLDPDGVSVAGVALSVIARGRARGWSDDDIIARTPEALAVVTPTLGPRAPLPRVDDRPGTAVGPIATREQLRLRVRWVHELTRQIVRELGRRFVDRGVLADADDVRRLLVADLHAAVLGAPIELPEEPVAVRTPVPAAFRLSADGAVVGEATGSASPGVGASGGRATGPVVFADPGPGDVLVVDTLDPSLAPALSTVAAIVAETGSPLSHLAILARERHVPVVVGYADARSRLDAGVPVSVDGTTGDVEILAEAGEPA